MPSLSPHLFSSAKKSLLSIVMQFSLKGSVPVRGHSKDTGGFETNLPVMVAFEMGECEAAGGLAQCESEG